ncbi:GNAT family N-acetyltransferase [Flavivirga amylovorans]|uniref:GNAT family N-acetyltransferase n=1 Tax=Flavivirga amylovorans TaxID=870486 RepID=A0ABT8X1U9_9FLAO|nr:GNAT family N-acetyltransferase [Flavivirga amylovorans]MDO5987899.1 GNAT family N-acetyltransferase [Flavivirga amylovorans]
MNKKITVEGLTKKMLQVAIDHNTYWRNGLAPLPKSKAIWLLNNPRIEDNDYCCLIAQEGEKIISFIYMIPDFLNTRNSLPRKVYWMILWWVHPKYEKTVLGTYAFSEALKLADNKIIIKSYAEHVSDFYEKQPFTVIASRLRYTIFLSVDPSMLVGRFKFLKPFRYFLDRFDYIVATIINKINHNKLKKNAKDLIYDYINELDEDIWDFIEPLCKNDLIFKSKEYINWQIDNKQYTQFVVPGKQQYKSLETGISNNIYGHSLKIIKGKEIIGFLSYIINYNEFNVKYFIVEKEKNYDLCIDALIHNFIKKKTKFIFTDDAKLAENIRKRFFTVFTHKAVKKGLAHNSLELNLEKINLLNRDGHFY